MPPEKDAFELAEAKFKDIFKGFKDFLGKDLLDQHKEMFKEVRRIVRQQPRATERPLERDVQGPPQLSDIVANPSEHARRYPRDPMYAYDLRDADRAWLHANDEL